MLYLGVFEARSSINDGVTKGAALAMVRQMQSDIPRPKDYYVKGTNAQIHRL